MSEPPSKGSCASSLIATHPAHTWHLQLMFAHVLGSCLQRLLWGLTYYSLLSWMASQALRLSSSHLISSPPGRESDCPVQQISHLLCQGPQCPFTQEEPGFSQPTATAGGHCHLLTLPATVLQGHSCPAPGPPPGACALLSLAQSTLP